MGYHRFSIKDIVEICKNRREDKFDGILAVVGKRGLGKSTLAYKIAKRHGNFRPKKDLIYDLDSLRKALSKWDKIVVVDEAIYAAYKRKWQNKGQIELIQQLNAYRDHRNTVILCIPNFWDLDKALRDMVFMRIDIVSRGKGAIHLPRDSFYSQDIWDSSNNEKIEKQKVIKNTKRQFYKFSTFTGFVKFKALSEKDELRYQKIKNKKRNEHHEGNDEKSVKKKTPDIYQILYDMKKEYGKVTPETAQLVARIKGVKPQSVMSRLRDIKAVTPSPR